MDALDHDDEPREPTGDEGYDDTAQMDAAIRDWLKALPEGMVLGWSDNALGAGFNHFLGGWVDVQVPLAMRELGLNWLWTVDFVEPGVTSGEQGGDTVVTCEGDVLIVDTPGGERLRALACYYDGTARPLTPEEIGYVDNPDLDPTEIGGYLVRLQPLTRIETIDRALEELAARITGRADLRFRFEPEIEDSPMLQVAKERMEEAQEALEMGDTGRFVKMELDDPDWMADFLGVSRAEAEAHIAEARVEAEAFRQEIDRLIAARRERARRLLVGQGLLYEGESA